MVTVRRFHLMEMQSTMVHESALRSYVELTKPRILLLVILTALPVMGPGFSATMRSRILSSLSGTWMGRLRAFLISPMDIAHEARRFNRCKSSLSMVSISPLKRSMEPLSVFSAMIRLMLTDHQLKLVANRNTSL